MKKVEFAVRAAVSKAEEKSEQIRLDNDEAAFAEAEKAIRAASAKCEEAASLVVREIIGKWQS